MGQPVGAAREAGHGHGRVHTGIPFGELRHPVFLEEDDGERLELPVVIQRMLAVDSDVVVFVREHLALVVRNL